MPPIRVAAPGLGKFRRDLRRIDKGLSRAADAHIRGIAKKVREDAREDAPKRSGRLARSLRYSLRARGASVYSTLVYAPVQEFGGTIRPRGTPITVDAHLFVSHAVEANTAHIEEEMGGLLDAVANANGFRGAGHALLNELADS